MSAPARRSTALASRVDPVDRDSRLAETGRRGQGRVEAVQVGPQLVGEVGRERSEQDPRAGLTAGQHPGPVQQHDGLARARAPGQPERPGV